MKRWLVLVTLSLACSSSPEDVLVAREPELETEVDAPQADAETDNPSLCSVANAVLCDGFETTPVQSPPWFFVNKASSVTLDTARFYRGNQSIHMHLDAEGDAEGVRHAELTETAVELPQPLYARTFVYVASPVARSIRIFGFLQAGSPNQGVQLYVGDGTPSLYAGGVSYQSATAFPLDRWNCVEIEVDTAEPGRVRVWLDDNEIPDLAVDGSVQLSPPLARISIGAAIFAYSATLPEHDVWHDEVILDSARVGCNR